MATPGTMAPEESVTVPTTVALVRVWAMELLTGKAEISNASSSLRKLIEGIVFLLRKIRAEWACMGTQLYGQSYRSFSPIIQGEQATVVTEKSWKTLQVCQTIPI